MPTVMAQPSTGAFHFPAVLADLEPLAGVLDAFQSNLVRLLQAAAPVAQPLRLISAIDPAVPEAGHAGGQIPLPPRAQSKPLLHVSRRDHHRHAQPEGIDPDRPLAPCDFLGPIQADVHPWRRRLATLAIRTARGGCGKTPLALACPRVQRVHNALPYPRPPPAAAIARDRGGLANMRGPQAPWVPRLMDGEKALEDAAAVQRLPSWAPRVPRGLRPPK